MSKYQVQDASAITSSKRVLKVKSSHGFRLVGYVINLNGICGQFMHRYKYDVRSKITIIFLLQDNRKKSERISTMTIMNPDDKMDPTNANARVCRYVPLEHPSLLSPLNFFWTFCHVLGLTAFVRLSKLSSWPYCKVHWQSRTINQQNIYNRNPAHSPFQNTSADSSTPP